MIKIKAIMLIGFILFTTLVNANNSRALKLMKTEQRVALVIGNNKYENSKLSDLRNPINDARAMKNKLRNLGFTVYYGENLTVRDMDKKVRSFSQKLSKGGVGLFFFAGHGVESDGKNFLMGKDSNLINKIDVAYESLELDKVLSYMKNSGNRLNIVLLDACRNDPFSRSGGGGLAKVDNAKGMFIAYATSPGDVADDGSGKHGVFTQQILNNIDKKGLSLHTLFKNIKRDVYKKTDQRQRPWTHDDIIGEFFFKLPNGTADLSVAKKPSTYSFRSKVPTHFSLTINTNPRDARVYITNIKPKYYDGIKLKKGTYNIKVKRDGYLTKEGSIELSRSENINIVLEKEQVVYKAKAVQKQRTSSGKTWKDRDTGLIWQVKIDTNKQYLNWNDAKNYCSRLTLDGYSNWKLPNRKELHSILTKNSYPNSKSYSGKTYIKKPLLNSMTMRYQWFWSATEYNNNSSEAWGVDFNAGYDYYDSKSDDYYVRCVVGRQ